MSAARPRSWYFGVRPGVGTPSLYDDKRRWVMLSQSNFPAEILARIDGGFCPLITRFPSTWPPPLGPPDVYVAPSDADQLANEGIFSWHFVETRYTVLAAWDRSGVCKPGMHSTFIVDGVWPADAFWPYIQEVWEDVFARISSRVAPILDGVMK